MEYRVKEEQWLIPFVTRGHSGPLDVNFLWKAAEWPVYVMDNHRLALWCWWQHLEPDERHGLIHIDRHYDCLWSPECPAWRAHSEEHRTELEAYLAATWCDDRDPLTLYRWDNIISGLVALDGEQLDESERCFATGCEGSRPRFNHSPWRLWDLLENLKWKLVENDGKHRWLVDIDLDYFTSEHPAENRHLVVSRTLIGEVGRTAFQGIGAGSVACVTVALSPETTGSWDLAEEILAILCESWPIRPELQPLPVKNGGQAGPLGAVR